MLKEANMKPFCTNHRHFWRVQTCCKYDACPRHIIKRFTLFFLFRKLCPGTCALHPCLMCLIRSKGCLACFLFYWRMSKIPVAGTGDFEDMEEGVRPTVEQAWSRMRISHGRASPLGSIACKFASHLSWQEQDHFRPPPVHFGAWPIFAERFSFKHPNDRSGGLLYLEALHQQDESVGDPAIGWGSKYVKICEREISQKEVFDLSLCLI